MDLTNDSIRPRRCQRASSASNSRRRISLEPIVKMNVRRFGFALIEPIGGLCEPHLRGVMLADAQVRPSQPCPRDNVLFGF